MQACKRICMTGACGTFVSKASLGFLLWSVRFLLHARPLLERLASRKEMEHRKKLCSTMLQQQYRMHNSICTFPSKHFYNNQLQNVQSLPLLPTVATVWPRQEEKVVWIDCDHPHHMGHVVQVGNSRSLKTSVLENNTSLQNPGEADLIVEVYKRLLRGGSKPEDIAIITPYKAQQQYIERSLKHVSTNSSRTAVGTVFKMQGSERHFVLLSFVRSVAEGWALRNLSMQSSSNEIRVSEPSSNPALRQTFETHIGIAGKADLLNVALTRAKSGLVIVGNRTVLSEGSEDFFQLATDLANRGTLLSEQEFRSRR
ncbi:unnamed protein product [Effrenium voratum]|nr:unnamed protein product [Effrenium voratum]